MKKFIFGIALLLTVSLSMNGSVFGLGSGESFFNSLSLKKRTDDPATGTGEGKIYYRGAIDGGIDSNTVLMLHMDGSDEGTVFTDVSDTPHTIAANGDANTEDSEKKFGVTSTEFDGSGDYLSISNSSDWDFENNTFTVDFWVYFNDISVTHTFFGRSNNVNLFQFYGSSSVLNLNNWSVGGSNHSWSPSADTWYHIALIGGNGSTDGAIYVDGIKLTDITSTGYSSTGDFIIGKQLSQSRDLDGYIDEFRVSSGARWTSNFTPPTKSYVSSSNEGLYFKDENGTVIEIIAIDP